MDEYIDNILREERFCDVIFPRLQVRILLRFERLDPSTNH